MAPQASSLSIMDDRQDAAPPPAIPQVWRLLPPFFNGVAMTVFGRPVTGDYNTKWPLIAKVVPLPRILASLNLVRKFHHYQFVFNTGHPRIVDGNFFHGLPVLLGADPAGKPY